MKRVKVEFLVNDEDDGFNPDASRMMTALGKGFPWASIERVVRVETTTVGCPTVEKLRNAEGILPQYTSVGCYPILYLTRTGCALCAGCATTNDTEQPEDYLVAADIFYEGAPTYCENCNQEIESAYGDPDAEKEQGQ